jgi:hypothetical protein
MCRLALTNPEYRKYPPIPVIRCAGYLPGAERAGEDGPDGKLTE